MRGAAGALCTAGLCRCGSLVDRTAPVFLAKVLAVSLSCCTLLLQSVENTCLYYCVHSACGLCSAELGPKSYLNRPCSSCNAGCTTNQHRGPIQLSFRRSSIARFSPPQNPDSLMKAAYLGCYNLTGASFLKHVRMYCIASRDASSDW